MCCVGDQESSQWLGGMDPRPLGWFRILSQCILSSWASCCVGVSSSTAAVCAGLASACPVVLTYRKYLLFHLGVAASKMLPLLFVNLGAPCLCRPKPVLRSSCFPAGCCFVAGFQAVHQCALQVRCLTSLCICALLMLSAEQLFGILVLSISSCGCPLVLMFCDWGFDTCKVTPHPCLAVDSLVLMLFCSLGNLGDVVDKMSIMYCRDSFFFLARKKAVCFCFALDCHLPDSPSLHFSSGCNLDTVVLMSEKSVSGPQLPRGRILSDSYFCQECYWHAAKNVNFMKQ